MIWYVLLTFVAGYDGQVVQRVEDGYQTGLLNVADGTDFVFDGRTYSADVTDANYTPPWE